MATMNEIANYIVRQAIAKGVDPHFALGMALSEGLNPNTIGSAYFGNRDRGGYSYGPYQLFSRSQDPNVIRPGGLAYDFYRRTGLSPNDPSTWRAQVNYAIDNFARGNYKPWNAYRDRGGFSPIQQIGANFANKNNITGEVVTPAASAVPLPPPRPQIPPPSEPQGAAERAKLLATSIAQAGPAERPVPVSAPAPAPQLPELTQQEMERINKENMQDYRVLSQAGQAEPGYDVFGSLPTLAEPRAPRPKLLWEQSMGESSSIAPSMSLPTFAAFEGNQGKEIQRHIIPQIGRNEFIARPPQQQTEPPQQTARSIAPPPPQPGAAAPASTSANRPARLAPLPPPIEVSTPPQPPEERAKTLAQKIVKDYGYQSTGEKVAPTEGRVNWGEPDNPADFFRADKALMEMRPELYTSEPTTEPEPERTYADGGEVPLLQDEYPTDYMPNVGRQVMADGGMPDGDGIPGMGQNNPPAPTPQRSRPSFSIAPAVDLPSDEQVGMPKSDTSNPTTMSLASAFDSAIQHHLSLSRGDRIANSKEAIRRLAPHIGMRKDKTPVPLLGKNEKLLKTEVGYKGKEPISLDDGRGIEAAGLALAPSFEMGNFNTCPNSASCKDECLGKTSGNYFKVGGGQDLSAFKGPRLNSLNKTLGMLNEPEAFAVRLYDEIAAKRAEAMNNGNHLGVRLNVLSDINPRVHQSIIKAFPDVTFYDYTKMAYRPVAENHHYTYSSTGLSQEGVDNPNGNWPRMRRMLDGGENVAMAFTDKEHLPKTVRDEETGKVYQVVNGDSHDFRPFDRVADGEDGVIIGLKNKKGFGKVGDAHKESKGFFVNYDPGRIKNNKGTYVREFTDEIGPSGRPKLGPTKVTNTEVVIKPQKKIREKGQGYE